MIILGLDISTSITGYCVLEKKENKIQLISAGSINLSKCKSFFEKAELVKSKLIDLKNGFNITDIVVEESLQSFRPGMSSAKTLYSLAKFNGVVCYIAEDVFKVKLSTASVITARSRLGIKISKKGPKTKEQVLEWVMQSPVFKNFSWPKKKLKSGPRKDMVIDDPSCYDIADASVVALYKAI